MLLLYGQAVYNIKDCQWYLTNFEGGLIQEWLQQHGPFDAVIDGANVGLSNKQNFGFFEVISYLSI